MTANILIACAHEDKLFAEKIAMKLVPLRVEIDEIFTEEQNIDSYIYSNHIDNSNIILLIVSAEFLNSDYCYKPAMKEAIKQHQQGHVRVIPIILRPVYWHNTPFAHLQVVPHDGKPVATRQLRAIALNEVIRYVRETIKAIDNRYASDIRKRNVELYTRRGVLITASALAVATITLAVNGTLQSLKVKDIPTRAIHYVSDFTYLGHADSVNSVAWSPNQSIIASASNDKTIQVWDPINGIELSSYTGHKASVTSVSLLPRTTVAASASSDHTVQIWETATANNRFTYRGHRGPVNSVAWSPNDIVIASASDDYTVQIWEAIGGAVSHTYTGHTGPVRSVTWSPDGTRIASASDDHTVQVWDAIKGTEHFTFQGHTSSVRSVAWSLDGLLGASGGDDHTVQIWDGIGGHRLLSYQGHTGPVRSVAWSSDGAKIASAGDDHSVRVGGLLYT